MEIEKYLNGGIIIDSGALLIEKDETLKFKFTSHKLEYHIKLDTDPGSENMIHNNVMSEDGTYLIINIINSHLENYVGNNELMEVGKIDNKVIALKFRINHLKNIDEVLFYYKWILIDGK